MKPYILDRIAAFIQAHQGKAVATWLILVTLAMATRISMAMP